MVVVKVVLKAEKLAVLKVVMMVGMLAYQLAVKKADLMVVYLVDWMVEY